MVPKGLEFSQESHAGETERMVPRTRGELVSQEEISHHFNHFAGDIGAETVRGSDGLNNISVRTA